MTPPVSKLAAFGANWQTACPVIRVLSPARAVGAHVLTFTNEYRFGDFDDVDCVIVMRDFPRFRSAYDGVLEWARMAGKPVVFTIDDLLTDLPSAHPSYDEYHEIRPHILRGIVQADLVVVTTPELKSQFERFNQSVIVVPNYLDETIWTLTPPARTDSTQQVTTIAYMGTASHAADLDLLGSVLSSTLDEQKGKVQFKSYGTALPELLLDRPDAQYIPIEFSSYSEFAAYFQNEHIDVFVAPLLDNKFNRCKSNIKFLEYSALGVPGVYSNLPPYSSVVRSNENGILSDSLESWKTDITMLLNDADARNRIGKAALDCVRSGWMVNQHPNQWSEILGGVVVRDRLNMNALDAYTKEVSEWCEDILNELGAERQFHQTVERSRAWRLASRLRGIRTAFSR